MAGDSIYEAFGAAVAARRRAQRLTQAQLAAKVKMSRASIANIESGRQSVLLHHVYALAAALEVDRVADLLLLPLPKTIGEELRVKVSNQDLSKQSLSQQAEAQVINLVATALAPNRARRGRP